MIEAYLAQGRGSCLLQDPAIASLVEDSLMHGHGRKYELIAWVVMPNHVHVIVRSLEEGAVPSIVQGWKSFTSRQIRRKIGGSGAIWMRDYFDRWIRSGDHLDKAIRYVHENPVVAGLVGYAGGWPFSSANPEHGWNPWKVAGAWGWGD